MTRIRMMFGILALASPAMAVAQDRAGDMLSREQESCERMYEQQSRMMCNAPGRENMRDRCMSDADARKSGCVARAQERYDQAIKRR